MKSSSSVWPRRLHELQRQLTPDQVIFLTAPSSVAYLTGSLALVPSEREAFVIISADQAWMILAPFVPTPPAAAHMTQLYRTDPLSLVQHFKGIKKTLPAFTTVLIEDQDLRVVEYTQLQTLELKLQALPPSWLWALRQVKDDQELAAIQTASDVVSQAMAVLSQALKPGMTELEAKALFETELLRLNSSAPAFPTIVAFGAHAALPHHQPNTTPLQSEMAVLVDAGATIDGYRSDMTRTWWFGHTPSAEFLKVKELVHAAYQAAHQKATTHTQTEVTAAQVDQAAREVIIAGGYGPQFIHTTGHGVGLDIHEPPSLSHLNQTRLTAGMVLTIEPGVYVPDNWGYRFENTLWLSPTGAEELTHGTIELTLGR